MRNNAEDIALVQAAGFHVDDDNALLSENIPTKEPGDEDISGAQGWRWNGLDQRKSVGAINNRPSSNGILQNALFAMSYVEMFFMLFHRPFIKNMII